MTPEIAKVAEELRNGRTPQPVTVRAFLSWFGAQRRGPYVVQGIKDQLAEVDITTTPDFVSTYIDAPISFKLHPLAPESGEDTEVSQSNGSDAEAAEGMPEAIAWISKDPTYSISKLKAANQPIVTVKPDGTLKEAITLLLARGFSQLPVMTTERDVKGMITWQSIGCRLGLERNLTNVREAMEHHHHEIRSTVSIFDAIPIIVSNEYVLVRGDDNRITGIITANDLSLQFRTLTEPFLLLSEIENMIRNMIGSRFTPNEMSAARDQNSAPREIQSVADLTFGDYVFLLQNADRWAKLGLPIDRHTFCQDLDAVREIRNEVTHFDPDGITEVDLNKLRDFGVFLKQLQTIFSLSS